MLKDNIHGGCRTGKSETPANIKGLTEPALNEQKEPEWDKMASKETDFNNEVFRKTLAYRMGVKPADLKHLLFPQNGEEFNAKGIRWRVVFVRTNPARVAIEPVGVLLPEDAKQQIEKKEEIAKEIKEALTNDKRLD